MMEDQFEICTAFKGNKKHNGLYDGGKEEEQIKHEWQTFEQFQIGKSLENIRQETRQLEIPLETNIVNMLIVRVVIT